jgi:hypothetical protein
LRRVWSLQKNAGDQESGENEEEIHAHPTVTEKWLKRMRLVGVHCEHKQHGNTTKPVECRDVIWQGDGRARSNMGERG